MVEQPGNGWVGLRRGSEPERLHYYETALRELREMRELYDNGC